MALALLPLAAHARQPQKQDQRGAATWVADRFRSGDGVICVTWGCALAMDYYQPALLPPGSPGRFSWRDDTATGVDASTLAAYVPVHGRVFLVADDSNAEVTSAGDWLSQRYHLVARFDGQGTYGPVTVLEYDITPASGS